jgi:hypothetical protein
MTSQTFKVSFTLIENSVVEDINSQIHNNLQTNLMTEYENYSLSFGESHYFCTKVKELVVYDNMTYVVYVKSEESLQELLGTIREYAGYLTQDVVHVEVNNEIRSIHV